MGLNGGFEKDVGGIIVTGLYDWFSVLTTKQRLLSFSGTNLLFPTLRSLQQCILRKSVGNVYCCIPPVK
jgi:hypothetical protein